MTGLMDPKAFATHASQFFAARLVQYYSTFGFGTSLSCSRVFTKTHARKHTHLTHKCARSSRLRLLARVTWRIRTCCERLSKACDKGIRPKSG